MRYPASEKLEIIRLVEIPSAGTPDLTVLGHPEHDLYQVVTDTGALAVPV